MASYLIPLRPLIPHQQIGGSAKDPFAVGAASRQEQGSQHRLRKVSVCTTQDSVFQSTSLPSSSLRCRGEDRYPPFAATTQHNVPRKEPDRFGPQHTRMSKKHHILHQTGESLSSGVEGSPPQLFARKASGSPFLIGDSDNPYEKRHAGQDYLSRRREAAARSKVKKPILALLGFDSRVARTSRRTRRALVAGLFLLCFLLYHSATAMSQMLPAVGAPTIVPSLRKAIFARDAQPAQVTSQGGTKEQSGLHTYHPNGLLLVNENGRHPIHVLIENANKKWKDLVGKQSTTLEAATAEYKRRYQRNPPIGWDKWWAFAQENNVQLVDEYDQIAKDLDPYWALDPKDLRHRNKVMQERVHTFTLSIRNGEVSRHGQHADLLRAKDMEALISKFAKWVPGEVNMTFIADDNPAVMLTYEERDRMLELARQGEYWGPSEFLGELDPHLSNFGKACPPNSAWRQQDLSGTPANQHLKDRRSFIHDHMKAVDICQHPESRELHGHTATGGMPITPLVPLFTWAKTTAHSDILVTPLEQYDDDYLVYDPPFSEKEHNKLMWRGSTTGTEFRKGYNWELSQRARLHFMGAEKAGRTEYMWSDNGVMRIANASTQDLSKHYLDMSFSGAPAQCDPEICEMMSNTMNFAPMIGLEGQNTYKYLMDVDGNGWSGRFHRLLSTNAAVLKSTVFPEWYASHIVPWVHYIPVKIDYSDMYDILAFFIGTPDGKGAHEDLAEAIGRQGREFAQRNWRRVDMASYMFRLVLEYGRLIQQEELPEVDYFGEI